MHTSSVPSQPLIRGTKRLVFTRLARDTRDPQKGLDLTRWVVRSLDCCPGPAPPGTVRNLFNGPPLSPWLVTTEGGGGTADKDSLYTGLVSHGDRTRAKGDTTRRGSVLCDLPPVLVYASGVVELHSTTTGRQLEHPGGHPPYAIRRGKEHPGPLVFPWVLQSPRAWATSLPPPANKGVPARCSRPFMTRHSHAWFDGMQQGVSQSLCELLASRSNMNMISLNRYSFIRGEVQFLRGRKIMFLLAKEAATGGRVGGDCPSAIALGG